MEQNSRVALVLGATGLVGSELVKLLIRDKRFSEIILFGRRLAPIDEERITQHIVDFDKPEEWSHLLKGDVLFSAFGTTIKKAGSQANQYRIDYTYQYNFAKAAEKNGVKTYILISAAGAKAGSAFFYNRMKGELDDAVSTMTFENIIILKPSLLAGKRQEHRAGEEYGNFLGKLFKFIPGLKKYRPIQAEIVAKAMVNSSFLKKGKNVYVADELFMLAK